MYGETSGFLKAILSVLLFPTLFQTEFLNFAWGVDDIFWMMIAKRLFLLLPVLAIILGLWISIACIATIIVRQNRRQFITALFITWWDLGKSVVSFWGGIFKFIYVFIGGFVGLFKVIVLGIWSMIQEIILMPLRLVGRVGQGVVKSSVPWIAVILTIFWCLIEGVIFTYVTTPLVIDTFSNITGEQFNENFIRIPLFIFLLFIVLGSYAVLSTMVDAVKSKNITAILGIGVIEIIVLLVEVVFLYREFVDSIVPWFAQYSENFELGIFWTLAISCFAWFGIRSLSWFLFAAHGTPTILSIIQGKGLELSDTETRFERNQPSELSSDFMRKIKADATWVQQKGEELLAAFMLPPLQIVASAINFCTLLVTGNHLFELPFKSINAIIDSKHLMENISSKQEIVNGV